MAGVMTSAADLLVDVFGRIHEGTTMVVDGLSPAELSQRVAPGANTIGWLVCRHRRGLVVRRLAQALRAPLRREGHGLRAQP